MQFDQMCSKRLIEVSGVFRLGDSSRFLAWTPRNSAKSASGLLSLSEQKRTGESRATGNWLMNPIQRSFIQRELEAKLLMNGQEASKHLREYIAETQQRQEEMERQRF